MQKTFLTASDAARLLNMSAAGVRVAADEGRLVVAAKTPGGVRLFTRSSVELFRRQRCGRKLRPKRDMAS